MSAIKELKNGKSQRQRKSGRRNSEQAKWHGIHPELLYYLVVGITERGGAVRFGTSRDGGAYNVGVYLDDDYWNDWGGSLDEISGKIRDLIEEFPPTDGRGDNPG